MMYRRHRSSRRSALIAHAILETLESRQLLAGDPIALGPERPLPGDTTPSLSVGDQVDPSLAEGPDGISLAVWEDTRSAGSGPIGYFGVGNGTMADIYAARVRADGSVIDVTPIPVSIASWNQGQPEVAWNGQNWLVAWSTERSEDMYETDINVVRVSPDGVVLDQQPRVVGTHLPDPNASDDIDPAGPMQVLSNGQDWYVTWWRHNPTIAGGVGTEYFATRVLADGTVPNAEGTKILTGNQWYKDFGFAFADVDGGQFLHAYDNDSGSIILRRFDANMNLIAGSQRTMSNSFVASVSLAGGPEGWLLAWEQDMNGNGAVKAARVDKLGNFLDTTALTVASGSGVDFSLDAMWSGVDWVIAYSNYASAGATDHDIFNRRLNVTGAGTAAFKGAATMVIGGENHQTNPNGVGGGDGGVKILFNDSATFRPRVATAVISPSDALLPRVDAALAAPSQSSADLASDGTNFLMIFNSSTAYGTQTLAQRVAPDGTAIDAEPFQIADPAWQPGGFEIVYFQGRYVVFFNATSGPNGKAIYAREVQTDGTVGPVINVAPNAPFTGFSLADVSVNNDRILLTGTANEGSLHTSWLFGRVFDANLQPVSPRFRIAVGYVTSTDVTALGNRWLVTLSWKPTHDSPRNGIAYSFVELDGQTAGQSQTLVSTYPANGAPTVVSNGNEAASEALITWVRNRDPINPQMNNENAIVGQRISVDGTRIGGVFNIIDEPEEQTGPAAVFDGTNYVLTWTDQRNYPWPAQARDDIFAARVAVDGTVIDPGGFPVADSFRPENAGDVGVAGGKVMFAYRTFRHEAPWGSYRLATRGASTPDSLPPAIQATPGFEYERDQAVRVQFDAPLMTVDVADMIVENIDTSTTVPSNQFRIEIIPANTQPWTYRWVHQGAPLANGNYRATLPAGSVTDLAGNPTTNDVVIHFRVLAGDADGNGVINFDDYARIDAGFNQNLTGFSNGDFNYDGVVNFDDYALIDLAFNSQDRPGTLPKGGKAGAGLRA